jgi:hypothetical protein
MLTPDDLIRRIVNHMFENGMNSREAAEDVTCYCLPTARMTSSSTASLNT